MGNKQIRTAGGMTIGYQESGSGEPLILLMGLGAPSEKWAPHIAAYEKHFHCYATDNRGAGISDKPVAYAYTIREMAEDTIAFMDAMDIEKAHFNGISMGGAIAQYLAVFYPERVRSVILTNTFPNCCVTFRRSIELVREANGQLDPITAGRLTQWIIYAQPFQEEHEDEMLKAEAEDLAYPHPMPSYAFKAQCNAILGFDILDRLPEIKAPVLIVGGELDLFAPVYVTKKMAEAIPGAKLYMAPGGGHVQHWEQLEKYNQVTLDFLLENREGA